MLVQRDQRQELTQLEFKQIRNIKLLEKSLLNQIPELKNQFK